VDMGRGRKEEADACRVSTRELGLKEKKSVSYQS
jgi:hypothetical protein